MSWSCKTASEGAPRKIEHSYRLGCAFCTINPPLSSEPVGVQRCLFPFDNHAAVFPFYAAVDMLRCCDNAILSGAPEVGSLGHLPIHHQTCNSPSNVCLWSFSLAQAVIALQHWSQLWHTASRVYAIDLNVSSHLRPGRQPSTIPVDVTLFLKLQWIFAQGN